MIIQELDGVEIDHCHSCGGIWLDAGELELLLDGSTPIELIIAETGEKRRRCPICRKTMRKMHHDDSGRHTLLDQCPNGHGLWFDAGELHKVIGSTASGNPVAQLLREMFMDSGIKST